MDSEYFEQAIETLHDLGLSIVQAKVYLTLLKSETMTIKNLANSSHVARTDLYRVIHELEKKGLVEKIIGNPTQFRPVSLTETLPALLERKNIECHDLQTRASTMLKTYKKINIKNKPALEESNFTWSPKNRELFHRHVKEMLASTHKSIDIAITSKRFHFIAPIFGEDIKRAVERGVKFRILREYTENENPMPKALETLQGHLLFETRYIQKEVPTPIWLADNSRLFVVTSAISSPSSLVSTLWTDNTQIVAVFQNFFEILWSTAEKQ